MVLRRVVSRKKRMLNPGWLILHTTTKEMCVFIEIGIVILMLEVRLDKTDSMSIWKEVFYVRGSCIISILLFMLFSRKSPILNLKKP